ncbi:MAG TPA: hypothetical protein DDW76_11235 [Cyanobacteria bacterium UBA11369]|nr:hypothetical protein [Cyanobacteria bacterium UBA11371]HBE32540.1 hypothetical protein [Cyanobacteria bacterium UBA11368]HBE49344.1 hypothetical protein [Cyanobacteria bacterium UBA11369]
MGNSHALDCQIIQLPITNYQFSRFRLPNHPITNYQLPITKIKTNASQELVCYLVKNAALTLSS